MLFRRRKPADILERARTCVWPRRSFARSAQYFAKRVLRLSATPHAIAAGVAAGVFASFLPFIGLHFVIAAVLAWVLAGNLLASAFGTAIGNPLTFPFIWGGTLEAGRLILYGNFSAIHVPVNLKRMLYHGEFGQLWEPFLKPMTIGAIPIGLVFAVSFYFLTRWATAAFRERRRRQLAEKARLRASVTHPGGSVAGSVTLG